VHVYKRRNEGKANIRLRRGYGKKGILRRGYGGTSILRRGYRGTGPVAVAALAAGVHLLEAGRYRGEQQAASSKR
jgi:hypothetical protein